MRVERRHAQGGQPHQDEVGKHESREIRGEPDLSRIRGPAGRHDAHDPRRREHAEDRDGAERDRGGARHRAEHPPEARAAVLRQGGGEHGNERGGERALGEKAPQEIGNAKGDEKGVRDRPRAEGACHHHVAHEPQDAAQEGGETDRAHRPHDPVPHVPLRVAHADIVLDSDGRGR